MYNPYYRTMMPMYRGHYDDRFFLAPLTAGLIGLGIGFLGAGAFQRPYCCPYPFYGPWYGYPWYGPWYGPGFYGYPRMKS